MVIDNVVLESACGKTKLTADVAFKGEPAKQVYFAVDKTYEKYIYNDASPFLAAFLLPCMRRKENLYVLGNVSKKQYLTIEKIIDLLVSWNRGFNKIKVYVKSVQQDNGNPKYAGCFFTGGVDSFYTYLKNKSTISHLVLIYGCDIPLKNHEFFREVENNTRIITDEIGIRQLTVESNFRKIIEPKLEWEWELGSALASVSLFLRNGFKEMYIPGGMRYDQLCPYGTHPYLDPLWSSENISIIHDGCEYSRFEKVMNSISRSTLALKYLRVCCHILKNKYNCNECMKCLLTKMELKSVNALDKAQTFDSDINIKSVEKIFFDVKFNFHLFGEELLQHLQQQNTNTELQKALQISLYESKKPSILRKLTEIVAVIDKKYNNRRLYDAIFSTNSKQDRTFLFKAFAHMGMIK